MDSMGSMGGFGGRDMAPVGRMGGKSVFYPQWAKKIRFSCLLLVTNVSSRFIVDFFCFSFVVFLVLRYVPIRNGWNGSGLWAR